MTSSLLLKSAAATELRLLCGWLYIKMAAIVSVCEAVILLNGINLIKNY